jgi:hypothetical protein
VTSYPKLAPYIKRCFTIKKNKRKIILTYRFFDDGRNSEMAAAFTRTSSIVTKIQQNNTFGKQTASFFKPMVSPEEGRCVLPKLSVLTIFVTRKKSCNGC